MLTVLAALLAVPTFLIAGATGASAPETQAWMKARRLRQA